MDSVCYLLSVIMDDNIRSCQYSLSIPILVCKGFLVPTERVFLVTSTSELETSRDDVSIIANSDSEPFYERCRRFRVPASRPTPSETQIPTRMGWEADHCSELDRGVWEIGNTGGE